MSCPIQNSSVQVRAISDLSYHSEMVMVMSEEILHRVRHMALALFEQLRQDPLKMDPVVVPLSAEQLTPIIQESISTVQKNNPLFMGRIHLARTADKVIKAYYENKRKINFSRKELEKQPNFFRDDRLASWMSLAQEKLIMYLEGTNEIKRVDVPLDHRGFSCYRYALTEAGVEINGLLSEEKLLEILFSKDFQVVESPDKGDLVLFLNQGKCVHLGIYEGNGYVLSKEGNHSPVAYVKRLEDFSPQYGNEVLYFCKLE